jgi:hypothetical protein
LLVEILNRIKRNEEAKRGNPSIDHLENYRDKHDNVAIPAERQELQNWAKRAGIKDIDLAWKKS